jgi:prepilin-type N-terminal cleavage/methylation domain-containing protein
MKHTANMRPDKKDSLKSEVSSVKADASTARTAHSRPSGFTFIEMLATVVLLAIIMPVAMHSIGLCTRLAGQSRREVEAASLAKAKLTELAVTGDWQNGNQRGDFGTDWPGYDWTATVTNWTDSSVRQLDLTVSWQSAGRRHELTLSTLMRAEEGSG